jgi:hypothetical protein
MEVGMHANLDSRIHESRGAGDKTSGEESDILYV